MGYISIPMKNDFAQIYPDGITPAAEQYQKIEWTEMPGWEEEFENAA